MTAFQMMVKIAEKSFKMGTKKIDISGYNKEIECLIGLAKMKLSLVHHGLFAVIVDQKVVSQLFLILLFVVVFLSREVSAYDVIRYLI
jgi:hypothetical protein